MDRDPWNWSVQDVQQFFGNDAASYIADMPHGRLPQLDSFLNALGDNDVSGAALLEVLDAATLRDDCGIRSLGQRGAILHCITKLRRQSTIYNAQNASFGLQTPPLFSAELPDPTTAARDGAIPSPETPQPIGEHVRPGELEIEDPRGRKRRRLNLSKPHQPVKPKWTLMDLTASTVRSEYLGDGALPVDEIFYGGTGRGVEIAHPQPSGNMIVLEPDREHDYADQNYHFHDQNKTVGESRYVYSRMRHFLKKDFEDLELSRGGRAAKALLPYPEHLCLSSQSATVVRFNDSPIPIAVRENAVDLKSGHDVDGQLQQSSGEWDFLMDHHEQGETNVLPTYGDSDSGIEDDEEMSSSTANTDSEAEEDDEDEDGLSRARISDIIDHFIDQSTDKWTAERLPRLEQTRAWTIWRQTKRSYSIRDALIQGAESWILRFTERLNKMKNEMVSDTYHSEDQLLRACVNMEETVKQREKQRWMIDVWKRRQEPPHTIQPKESRKHHASSSAAHQEPPMIIHPHDRFRVSPAPMAFEDPDHEADDEMQDENAAEGDEDESDEIQYEAEAEEFHTPTSSPALSQDLRDFIIPSTEEAEEIEEAEVIDPVVEFEESLKDDLQAVNDKEHARNAKDENYLPTGDENENDSESELPSPSTFVAPQKIKTPKKSKKAAVDLTSFSESEPVRRPGRTPKGKGKIVNPKGEPTSATAEEVDSWDFKSLVTGNDRHRILIRLLKEAGSDFRDALQEYFGSAHLGRGTFIVHLHAAVESFRTCTKNPNLPSDKAEVMSLAAEIFIRWAIPSLAERKYGTLDTESWKTVLERKQFDLFTSMLKETLQRKDSKLFVRPKQSPIKGSSSAPIDISSSSDTRLSSKPLTQKRRKKPPPRSTTAMDLRVSAQKRAQRYNESQTTDPAQLEAMLGSDPSYSRIEINPTKGDEEDFVHVADEVAQKMKAHQIDGVRFLWREITADGEDKAQGCILAHTMGLGKTMQSISFLSALNEAAASREPRVYEQLPPRLRLKAKDKRRHLRTLVLCPSGLIENWLREIQAWASKQQLGHVWALDTSVRDTNMPLLDQWMKYGGVMIVGYPRFRTFVTPDKPDKKNLRPTEEVEGYQKMFFEGPEVVVADEAHMLKNDKASITKAAQKIETHSRIALTGTPMANDVDEIYSLVSWSAPGFLGEPREFSSYFSIPIKAGIYKESSSYEKRQSTIKLKVLHSEIEPKVNRANIEVLKGSLKSKVEFVIRISLGATQDRLFRRYVQLLRHSDKTDDAATVAFFAWLEDMTLIVNHPECFRQKLLNPKSKPKKKNNKSRHATPGTASDSGSVTPLPPGYDETGDEVASDATGDAAGAENIDEEEERDSLFTTDETRALLEAFPENKDPELSTKVSIFLKLLKLSLERKDKVLVFSGKLRTLDYLQDLLKSLNLRAGRIDGKTKMDERMKILEKFHNEGRFDSRGMNVMLVSTSAGGVGLNIQDANRVFIFDFSWNPTKEEQAIGRSYRLGQQRPVYVYHLMVSGTFEENIYNKRLFKSSLAKRVVDKKTTRRSAERDIMDYLYEPKDVPQTDVVSKIGSDQYVLDRLLSQHGTEDEGKVDTMIRSVETMAVLQEEVEEAELTAEDQKDIEEQIKQGREGRRNYKPAAPAMRPPQPSVPSAIQARPMVPPTGYAPQPPPATMPAQAAPGAPIMQAPHPPLARLLETSLNGPALQFGVPSQAQAPGSMMAPSYRNPNSQPSAPGLPHSYDPRGGLPMGDPK